MTATRVCPVCDSTMYQTHVFTLMGSVDVSWFLCDTCELWASEEPYWLEQAYSESMSSLDTGAAERTLLNRRVLAAVIVRLLGREGPFVDWAGGPGLLTRFMRDLGLDFHWQDSYTQNSYALGFEWEMSDRPATAVTAIEVFEHLPDPRAFVDEVLRATGADTLIFTQELHHGPDVDWWYRTPATGQHIAFYSPKTLDVLAGQFDLRYLNAGKYHMLTRRPITQKRFQREVKLSRLTFPIIKARGQSLTWADHQRAASARQPPKDGLTG